MQRCLLFFPAQPVQPPRLLPPCPRPLLLLSLCTPALRSRRRCSPRRATCSTTRCLSWVMIPRYAWSRRSTTDRTRPCCCRWAGLTGLTAGMLDLPGKGTGASRSPARTPLSNEARRGATRCGLCTAARRRRGPPRCAALRPCHARRAPSSTDRHPAESAGPPAQFAKLRHQGCSFLVAGRVGDDGKFRTLADLEMPDMLPRGVSAWARALLLT